MNLILLQDEDFEDGSSTVRFSGRRARHVHDVHRAEVGDRLCVGRLGGEIGMGRVREIARDRIALEVALSEAPPPKLPLSLVLALPRPRFLKRVLLTAASMGVARIVLLGARRVERSFWGSRALQPAALRDSLCLGLEQGRDTVLPELWLRPRPQAFLREELPGLVARTRGLVGHPEAEAACPRAVDGPVTLAIGPEGGFVPAEVEAFEAAGCQPVHLGSRPLRVEAAVPALLGRLF
ncbi:MAG: 16S rRNA (uracil(1498)-N(3))-methyltransferase [Proteobacteria bacterium]|nr:16S rRNA (uracil(1498)-N(3))-methyltransferase [Pseudomonadota bacterium]